MWTLWQLSFLCCCVENCCKDYCYWWCKVIFQLLLELKYLAFYILELYYITTILTIMWKIIQMITFSDILKLWFQTQRVCKLSLSPLLHFYCFLKPNRKCTLDVNQWLLPYIKAYFRHGRLTSFMSLLGGRKFFF